MRRDGAPAYTAVPIDAFGDGGFRIAGVRHDGAILILGGVRAWPVSGADALTAADFAPILDRADRPDMAILGTGARLRHPPAEVRRAFREAGVGLEVLNTASACRTWNLLAGEARRVFAALLPV